MIIWTVLLSFTLSASQACNKSAPEDPWKNEQGSGDQSTGLNLAAGKFYKLDPAPTDAYPDMYPCQPWSDGTKLTDEEIGTVAYKNKAVGWTDVPSATITVDLGVKRKIWEASVHALADNVFKIGLPSSVKVSVSSDGKKWSEQCVLHFENLPSGEKTVSKSFEPVTCRYVRYEVAAPASPCKSMLIDEIVATGEYRSDWKYVPKEGAYHGAFNNKTSFADEGIKDQCQNATFEERVGKKTSMVLWYQNMREGRTFAEVQAIRRDYLGKNFGGNWRFFMYGWSPNDYTAMEVAGGILDEYWKKYFEEVRKAQSAEQDYGPVWFRPANEMNSNWVKWGNDPVNFIKMWRRLYNIAEQYSLTDYNVFVWSSADISFGSAKMKAYYPGDQYVDWIGTSCYFSKAVSYGYPSYLMKETEAISANKPVMISEGGYGTSDCDNLLWVREWFGLKETHPRVKAVVWENHENPSVGDRRIHKDAAALAEYRKLVKDSYWLDAIPSEVLDEIKERKARQNKDN